MQIPNEDFVKLGGMHQLIMKHTELHHYTNLKGLSGITKQNMLRATRWNCLNDKTEVQHFREYAITELTERIRQHCLKEMKEKLSVRRNIESEGGLLNYAKNNAESFIGAIYQVSFETSSLGVPMASPFIISFCGHKKDKYTAENGLLSQWRGYGGEQRYAIVFNTKKLCDLLSVENQKYRFSYVSMSDVIYNDDDLNFSAIYNETFEQLLSAWLVARDKEPPSFEKLFVQIMSGSTCFKHRAFVEEREVRIVVTPLEQRLVNDLKRKGDTTQKLVKKVHHENQRDYVEIFEGDYVLPIKRIIVGPGHNQNDLAVQAEKLVQGKIEIINSQTPYID